MPNLRATQDDILKLTEALEFMPLAIVQEAAYIRHPVSRYSVAKYLEDFQSGDSQKLKLLDHDVDNIHRDIHAKNSILVTWSLSFEHTHQTRPSATDLLSLMSLFGIPEAVLHKQIPQEPILVKAKKQKITEWFNSKFHNKRSSSAVKRDSSEDFEESDVANIVFDIQYDIMMLRDYCLVLIDQDSSSSEMHRLGQLPMQKWLAANDELEKWRTIFVGKLNSEFIDWPSDEDRSLYRSLFPHVQSASLKRPLSRLALSSWALFLYKAAS